MALIGWHDLATNGADRHDGRQVEIAGWPCPFGIGDAGDYFALLAEMPCCAGCLPRDPAARIEVFATAPVEAQRGPVRLRGRWQVVGDDGSGWRYQLRDAHPCAPLRRPPAAITRRRLLAAGPLLCAGVAQAGAEETGAAGPAIDVHSHAGHIIVRGRTVRPFTDVAGPMRDGGMAVICLAVVSDAPTHRVMADGRIHPFRDPAPGELRACGELGFQRVHALAAAQGLAVITDAAALGAARPAAPGVIVAAEGADFLEGTADGVDDAYHRWQLRHLQLTHYRVNELGDIQTEPPVHGGLTAFGAEVVRRCNRLGVVVDVAHGTYDLVRQAAQVTTRPLVLSHTSLTAHPRPLHRTIGTAHARAVADTGGVIGIWPPAAIFRDLPALARGMARMVDTVGIDHVGLGSDMLGLVGPSAFASYRDLPALRAALRDRGFSEVEIGKLLGGNYRRVFTACMA